MQLGIYGGVAGQSITVQLYIHNFYYFKTEEIHKMSPPNWDDDFDFEDDDVPKKKKVTQQKKGNKNDDDFFDDEINTNKLPTINSKSNAASKQVTNNKRASARANPYAQNMKLRGNVYDDDENVYEEIEDEPKNKKNSNANKNKQPQQEMDFYEDIAEEPSRKEIKVDNKKSIIKAQEPAKKAPAKKPTQEQEYEQQELDDAYGEDFEEIEQQEPKSPVKALPQKNNKELQKPKPMNNGAQPSTQSYGQNTSLKKVTNNPPKPPSRASQGQKNQTGNRNMTVGKKPNIPRSQSRQSLKSIQSKRGSNSRAISNKFTTNASFAPNKYSSQIQKSFPQVNLSQLNQDKLNKLNERLRAMIRKFNQELNQLINKNMLYLKSKKNEKSVNLDDKARVLQEQCKNNETMIEIMEKQFEKLSGRDGELREEEYQLMTQKKIQQMKQLIKQTQKTIQKLKTQIKSQGNKLTNNQDKKLAAELRHLKTTLIQSKKDWQKQNERIQKLHKQIQDLNQKITEIDYKISELIETAQEKGIQLQTKQELVKKFQATKKKVQASKNHRAKLENLLRTKSDIISHEKEQLRINIKNCELEIKNLYDSISHTHNESVKVVQKAKNNPKLNQNLLGDLDSILKSLELVQPDNYSVRSQENRSQASYRPLKNSDIGNMEKSEPHKRSQSANNSKHIDMPVFEDHSKLNLLKKKPKVNEMPQEKKHDQERIWREDQLIEQNKPKPAQKSKEPEKPAQQEKDRKKPFTLKKNRLGSQSKPQEKTQADEIKNEGLKTNQQEEKKAEQQKKQEKKQQVSLAGPRMMKFKRKEKEQLTNLIPKQQEKPAEVKQIQQEAPKVEEDKPMFAPKRFNLRNRQQKKQDSYVPSVENKPQQKKQPELVAEKKTQQYKPKFNFGDVEDNFKKPVTQPLKEKQPQKIVIPSLEQKKQDQQSKPKFNLRLRDRKKNAQESGGYQPTGISQNKPAEQKPAFLLDSKDPPKNAAPIKQNNNNSYIAKQNNSNPYAPKQNTFNLASKRNQNKQEPKLSAQNSANNVVQKQPQVAPNNPNNPYTQNQTGGAARVKEGPIKKPKIQVGGQKKKINIYQQAEQAEGLNQFVNEPPKKQPQPPQQNYNPYAPSKEKDLNLNDLLGVKKKNDNDLADLLGVDIGNKKAKKNNDFFGDMDL